MQVKLHKKKFVVLTVAKLFQRMRIFVHTVVSRSSATGNHMCPLDCLRLTAGTIGAHSFVKAKAKQLDRTQVEFAPCRTQS